MCVIDLQCDLEDGEDYNATVDNYDDDDADEDGKYTEENVSFKGSVKTNNFNVSIHVQYPDACVNGTYLQLFMHVFCDPRQTQNERQRGVHKARLIC